MIVTVVYGDLLLTAEVMLGAMVTVIGEMAQLRVAMLVIVEPAAQVERIV